MSHQGKKRTDELLLQSLVCGATIESAAAKAGVAPRTVHRRLQDVDFQRRLAGLKGDLVKRAAAILTAAALESIKTLLALQEPNMPPAVRSGAARAILELGLRYREAAEVTERIEALEQRLEASTTQGAPERAA